MYKKKQTGFNRDSPEDSDDYTNYPEDITQAIQVLTLLAEVTVPP